MNPVLDREIADFIRTGVSISLAACNRERLPSINRALGCKVLDGGRQVAVFLNRSQAAELLDNIRDSGRVANVYSLPSSNRTLQLKGVDAVVRPFDAADLAIIAGHIDDFVAEVVPMGVPENVVRSIFAYDPPDLVAVVYTPSAVFSQTPGPKAGEPLA